MRKTSRNKNNATIASTAILMRYVELQPILYPLILAIKHIYNANCKLFVALFFALSQITRVYVTNRNYVPLMQFVAPTKKSEEIWIPIVYRFWLWHICKFSYEKLRYATRAKLMRVIRLHVSASGHALPIHARNRSNISWIWQLLYTVFLNFIQTLIFEVLACSPYIQRSLSGLSWIMLICRHSLIWKYHQQYWSQIQYKAKSCFLIHLPCEGLL